jgi:hypothetical protein
MKTQKLYGKECLFYCYETNNRRFFHGLYNYINGDIGYNYQRIKRGFTLQTYK